MVIPVGGYIHEVDILALAELLITLLAIVLSCLRQACVGKELLAFLNTVKLIVAEGYDVDTVDVGETLHGTGTAHAETHECNAYDGFCRTGKAKHVLLALRANGNFCLNGTAVPVPLGLHVGLGSDALRHHGEQAKGYAHRKK